MKNWCVKGVRNEVPLENEDTDDLSLYNINHEFQRFLMYEITCLGHDLIWNQKTVVGVVKCLGSMFEFKQMFLFIFAETFIFAYDTL